MKWINLKFLTLLCYFSAFSCFCLAAFLPQALSLSRVNFTYMAESRKSMEDVTKEIVEMERLNYEVKIYVDNLTDYIR